MNLVVGASGHLGSEICRRLVARGQPVRALACKSTTPSRRKALSKIGVELVTGELTDLHSIAAACHSVDTVIACAACMLSAQPDDPLEDIDQRGQINLVKIAQKANVKHYIYLSYSCNIDPGDDPAPMTFAKRTAEDCVMSSGINYTIFRPTCFMESWLSPTMGFDYAKAHARVYGPGTQKVSYIALNDVAEFVALAVKNPAAYNTVIELGGPQAISQLDVVRIFEELTGTRFFVDHISMESLQAERAHADEPRRKSIAAIKQSIAAGDAIDMRATLDIFPVEMTTVSDYAKRVLAN